MLIFTNRVLEIEHPLYLIRFNNSNGTSPWRGDKWNFSKQNVISLDKGIYGVRLDDMLDNTVGHYTFKFANPEKQLVLLESEENYVIEEVCIPNSELEFCKILNLVYMNLSPEKIGLFSTSVISANILPG